MSVRVQYSIEGRTAIDLARSVEGAIRRGRLAPGALLPTVRALATRLRVSPATVAAAYRALQSRGLAAGQGRRGTRVAFRPPLSTLRPETEVPADLRDLATGNPDPALLPPLRPAVGALRLEQRLYNEPAQHRPLIELAAKSLAADGIPSESLALVGGAMDGVERVLLAHLRPGDRVAVEDPGYPGVLDLLGALGLVAEPMLMDDEGVRPQALASALASGARAVVLTPRAQNPTGAALTPLRARRLRALLDDHPGVLVVEDDHAGPVAGAPAITVCHRQRPLWAVVRSVSKWLGPDLRLALLAGDAATIGRVEGRRALGSGWVSHVLQDLVLALWSDPRTETLLRRAAADYRERRIALVHALARREIPSQGRSGLNVWLSVPEEAPVIAALAAAGWAVRGGERYRVRSGPAIRITIATLLPRDAERLADDLARVLRPAAHRPSLTVGRDPGASTLDQRLDPPMAQRVSSRQSTAFEGKPGRHDRMATRAVGDTSQRELSYRKRLIEIANMINSAPSIQEILVDIKDRVLDLVEADRVTIFALDTRNQELFSLFKAGQEVKEIRVPKSFTSIAGFTALSRKTVNIKSAYDPAELTRLHPNLRFDSRWDKASGFRTMEVLSTPILFDKYLLGVLQLVNKRGGGTTFSPKDEEAAEELAKILGIAFYNQHRAARSNKPSKYGALVDKGLISEKDIEKAVNNARVNQIDVAKVLEEDFKIAKEEIGRALAAFYNCQFWEPQGTTMPEELKARLSLDFLKKNVAAPVEKKEGTLWVAVEDPFDLTRLDSIKAMNLSPRNEFMVGFRQDILDYLRASYGESGPAVEEQDLGRIIMELGTGEEDEVEAQDQASQPEVDETDSGIVKLANQIIIDGYNRGASDIHIEPYGKNSPTVVRFRVDGDCQKYIDIPAPHRNAIVQRFKIMSKLDIAEKRKPQDGKIRFKGPMGTIELRVATIPTSGGNEDVVMRILAASKPLPIEKMGFSERNLTEFRKVLQKPYGICLVVGPTGSGKTTTLHSGLGFINTVDMKIWTAEDPVEITQPGLRQVQVHPKIDFTFAVAMRAFLRADPDVIMVGEMRDHETAATGIEASLTGHLVFSTLHTNSAPETIVRLLDMEIDPFNFADALLGILAQRLVRTLCKDCKEQYAPGQEEFAELMQEYGLEHWEKLGIRYSPEFKLYRPKGCSKCGNSGYKGRMGIHELLLGTDEMKRLIQKRKPVEDMRKQAMRDGMTTLLQDGIQKVIAGVADFKQVRAVCIK